MVKSTHTENRYAVCIGINAYAPSAGLSALRHAKDDARALDIHSTSVIFGMTQRTQARAGRIGIDADAYGVAVLCVRRFHHKQCFTRSSGCEGSLSCMCIPPIICSSVAGECETSVAMSWIPCQ